MYGPLEYIPASSPGARRNLENFVNIPTSTHAVQLSEMTPRPDVVYMKATFTKLFVRIVCVCHLCTVYCVGYSITENTFETTYGLDTRSNRATLSHVTARSKIGCSVACVGKNDCGGYNYRKLGARNVECELKQGNSTVSDIQSDTGWTYYGKKGVPDPVYFLDCQDVQDSGITSSGIYQINLDPASATPVLKDVYCNMTIDGGGWMVLLRRQDGSVDFNRSWTPYRDGFGDLNGELWIGLEAMHLTANNGRHYQLRIDLTDFGNSSVYAKYDSFNITSEADDYRLYLGTYTGDAVDDLGTQNGYQFSTWDRCNDVATYNCAERYASGYWYKSCAPSRLTGPYGSDTFDPVINSIKYYQGILWYHWLGLQSHPSYADMKIKPI